MDARVRYTKKTIRESFFSLLETTPLAKITVRAICEGAEINRATFYKYYDNPYDLLDKLENELLDHLQQRITALPSPVLTDIFYIILEDILEKREIYLILLSKNGDRLFRKRLFALCYGDNMETIRALFPSLPPKKQEWVYYFIAEGCNGLLSRWLADGFQERPEELISFIGSLIAAINRSELV